MQNNRGFSNKSMYKNFFNALLFLTISIGFFLSVKNFIAHAETVTTSVTVGNAPPSFTAGPVENPVSSETSPTNVGVAVTFEATASDSNGENYYLLLCSTSSASATNGGAPTCTGTTWCTSSATTSGTQATCSYTTQQSDASSNPWYAFVCDSNASAASCSSGNQGTGDSGSPFVVNHAPTFTSVSNDSPKEPGQTVTWNTTASDSDTDNIKLLVCKTTGVSGSACDGGAGDTWCESSLVASNPSCGYSIPSVSPTGTHDAYVYVIDEHDLGSLDAAQGSNVPFTISNVTPVVSAVTINGGVAIDLEESTTKAVTLTATVTDNNSCQDLSSVLGYVYRSGIGYTGCDTVGEANNNYCYPEITCAIDGGTCADNTDASADYTCTVNLQYYADPTDTNTQYPTEFWMDTIKATDNAAATGNTEVASGVKLNSLTAFDITGAIDYGGLAPNESNDPLNQTITTTPTGNVGLDQEHSGSANMCTDYPTCSVGTPIAVSYQKYALASLTGYASGVALSTTPTEAELNVPKAITGTPTTRNTWWGILIPDGTLTGSYSGVNTVTAVKGEIVNW